MSDQDQADKALGPTFVGRSLLAFRLGSESTTIQMQVRFPTSWRLPHILFKSVQHVSQIEKHNIASTLPLMSAARFPYYVNGVSWVVFLEPTSCQQHVLPPLTPP